VAKAKVHIQGDPLAIEKPRFVAERMAHLSIRRAAALQDSIRPMSQLGPKTEVSGLARHVRFTLRCRHRQPAPACPFGAIALNRYAIARGGGRGAHQYGSTRGEMVSSVWVILS
jgi:hypothetical protein